MNIYEYNQEAVDAEVAKKAGFVKTYETHTDSQSIANALLKLEAQIKEGRSLYVDHSRGVFPGSSELGLRYHLTRPQAEVDAEVAAIRAQVEATEQARVEASRQAHIEAQVAAAVSAHEAKETEKAQRAKDQVAEKARAAAIAALGEAA